MKKLFSRYMKDESGATAIEYSLIAGLMAVALIAAVNGLTGKLSGTFTKIQNALPQ